MKRRAGSQKTGDSCINLVVADLALPEAMVYRTAAQNIPTIIKAYNP